MEPLNGLDNIVASTETGVISREEKLLALDHVLESNALRGSDQLKAFLRFVVEKSVENAEDSLKEYVIATAVFGRQSSYDPRTDSVVRVNAARLRTKLKEYYETEGQLDPVIIDLPKGRYMPAFAHHPPPQTVEREAPLQALAEVDAPVPVAPSVALAPRRSNVMLYTLGAACVLLAALAAYFYRQQTKAPSAVLTPEPVWATMLLSKNPILIAFSNTVFEGKAETGMKYSERLTLHPADSTGKIVDDLHTGVGEVVSVVSLSDLLHRMGHPFRLKRCLLLTWDDVKTENIVFVGSPIENELLKDLPCKQDFVFDKSGTAETRLVNKRPQAGEAAEYRAESGGPSTRDIRKDYALVSALKGPGGSNRLFVLAGLTTLGTQAATEYVTKPNSLRDLTERLKEPDGGLPDFYQVVLSARINGGVPVEVEYVTHHVLKP